MSTDRLFILDRVPVPAWLHDISEVDAMTAFGEQAEWGFSLPWMYQALAEPTSGRPMLQAPRRGDDFWPGALAYWSSLLHLLVYGFGWSRPDRGLRWWYDAGKPTDDIKLVSLSEVWDADGQLDWFAAWLWTTGNRSYLDRPVGSSNESNVVVDPEWLDRVERSVEESGTPAPYGGGYDPLHLTVHIDGPKQRSLSAVGSFTSDGAGDTAVLTLDSMSGWYRELLEVDSRLTGTARKPKGIEVVVRALGTLGVFHRSQATGLWFSGRHSLHLVGN